MSDDNFTYHTIQTQAEAEYSDRGSHFHAFTFRVDSTEEVKRNLKFIKAAHPKAVHHCYAYKTGFDGASSKASDDGEPSGSAGRPILGQIESLQLTNVLVIVVRYFGGVLLGIPGLIQAYKTVTQLALARSETIIKNRTKFYSLKFDYTQMNNVRRIIKSTNCEIREQDTSLFCEMTIGISLFEIEDVLKRFVDLPDVSVKAL